MKLTPALLHRIWTVPHSRSRRSAAAAQAPRLETSSSTVSAESPSFARLAAAARKASGRTSAIATLTPARARVRAMPKPIPLAPPVTKATLPATSRIESSHGKLRRSMADGRHPGLGPSGGLEALDVPGDGAQKSICFQQRKHPPDAGMHSVSPTQVSAVIATDVKTLRILPLARIAVGCGEHQPAALALGNHDALDLDIAHGDASGHARRGVPAQALIERAANQGRVRAQQGVLIGEFAEGPDGRGQRHHRRIR